VGGQFKGPPAAGFNGGANDTPYVAAQHGAPVSAHHAVTPSAARIPELSHRDTAVLEAARVAGCAVVGPGRNCARFAGAFLLTACQAGPVVVARIHPREVRGPMAHSRASISHGWWNLPPRRPSRRR
jgi:hypothetical protein